MIGKQIFDPEGNNWRILNVWTWRSYTCLGLSGISEKVAGQMGGFRYDGGGGGLTANVR